MGLPVFYRLRPWPVVERPCGAGVVRPAGFLLGIDPQAMETIVAEHAEQVKRKSVISYARAMEAKKDE